MRVKKTLGGGGPTGPPPPCTNRVKEPEPVEKRGRISFLISFRAVCELPLSHRFVVDWIYFEGFVYFTHFLCHVILHTWMFIMCALTGIFSIQVKMNKLKCLKGVRGKNLIIRFFFGTNHIFISLMPFLKLSFLLYVIHVTSLSL